MKLNSTGRRMSTMSAMGSLEPTKSKDGAGSGAPELDAELKLPALVNIEEDEDEDEVSPTGRAPGEGRDSRATDMGTPLGGDSSPLVVPALILTAPSADGK